MKPAQLAIAAAVGFLAYRAWVAYQETTSGAAPTTGGDGWFSSTDDVLQSAAQTIDSWSGGMLKISAMAKVDRTVLDNANVRAFLAVIRSGEGTAGPDGYRTLFGGATFDSLDDHPRLKIRKGSYTSTAAGAYQALESTWDETARIMGLPDFSEQSQDLFAVGRITARGALPDVIAGRFTQAISKTNKEWASLPGSPYGQPTKTMAQAKAIYTANGGKALA